MAMKRLAIGLILLIVAIGGLHMSNGQAQAETEYNDHFLIFIDANRLVTANNLAAQWDVDSGGGVTFGNVRLSATGLDPVTHYAASTPATPTMKNGITNALNNANWADMYTTEDVTAAVPHWTGPNGWTFDGGVFAAFQAALVHQGLQRIPDPE
jgi:hypothetical protein